MEERVTGELKAEQGNDLQIPRDLENALVPEPEDLTIAEKCLAAITDRLVHKKYVLAISHSNYLVALGGTEKVLHEEQSQMEQRGISYIQVYGAPATEPAAPDQVDQIVCVNVDSSPAGNFSIIQLGLVLRLLRLRDTGTPEAVHVHHMMNMSFYGVSMLIRALPGIKVRFFIHDYYTICPSFNLMKDEKTFCGGPSPDGAGCSDCTIHAKRKTHFRAIASLLEHFQPELIAPSEIAAGIWSRAYPGHAKQVSVVPHQIQKGCTKNDPARFERISRIGYAPKIAYLGYESMIKGLETWWHLICDEKLKHEYRFYHLGASGMNFPNVRFIPVSFIENGPDAMIRTLLNNHIDIAFLWSICPETYSFTLYEAFAANCMILTTANSGNIAAQVRKTERGIIFDSQKALFDYLENPEKVKNDIRKHLIANQPMEIRFNPRIAEETAEEARHKKELKDFSCKKEPGDNGHGKEVFSDQAGETPGADQTEDSLLVKNIHLETLRALQLQKKENHLPARTDEELARELSRYRDSRLHRLVDHMIDFVEKYQAIGMIMKKTFRLFWWTGFYIRRILLRVKG